MPALRCYKPPLRFYQEAHVVSGPPFDDIKGAQRFHLIPPL